MTRTCLVQRGGRRIAQQREPVLDWRARHARVGGGALVPSPAPCAQVVPGAKQFEEVLRHTFVDIQIGAKGGVEPFDGARGPMAFLKMRLDRVEQFIERQVIEL